MPEKSVAQKLFIKTGMCLLIVNAPRGYEETLGELPKGVVWLKAGERDADHVQLFVANRAELETQLPKVKSVLKPRGMLWVMYLKGTAKQKTDINRDTLHAYANTLGLRGVSLVAVDEDWSAMRFKVES